MTKFLLLLVLGISPALAAEDHKPGPPGPPGQSIVGPAGDDGRHNFHMPIGAGVRWFDTPRWQGVTAYQFDPIHTENTLSGLIIYKVGPDAQDRRIKSLEAQLQALIRATSDSGKVPEAEKPVRGVIRGKN